MSSMKDPKGLGKVTVAVAGTPVAIKSSKFIVESFTAQADPANVGTYMTLKDSDGNIMMKFAKGQSATLPAIGPFDLNAIKLDTDTNGDGAFIAYV